MSDLDRVKTPAGAIVRGEDVDTAPVPGRRTLTPYIDHGAVCDVDATRPGCFLDAGQRARLISEYKERVAHARESYRGAILRLQLDRLTSSPSSDLPWIAELLLDVVGAHAFTSILGAIQLAKAGELRMIERRIGEDAAGERLHTHLDAEMHRSLSSLSETSMGWWAKEMTDRGKKSTQSALKAALGARAKSDGGREIDYLDLIASESSHVFKTMREEPPAVATDAQLCALWEAFDDDRHSLAIYEQLIADKVARFMSSDVDSIGVSFFTHRTEMARSTQVVRLLYAAGPSRLAYLKSDAIDPQAIGDLVPAEFESVALARHQQVWGEPVRDMIVATPASSAGTMLPRLNLGKSAP